MSNLLKPYELSIWKFQNSSGTLTEKKFLTIGSDSMQGLAQASDISLTKNINGSIKLEFSLYYKYFDNESGEFVNNPVTAEENLSNGSRLKLKYDDEWYDFVVTNISEDGSTYKFTYSAEDAWVNELSKTGYNVVLNTELENNIGTITDIAAYALEDSDWEVDKENSDTIYQFTDEPLYEVELKCSVPANRPLQGDANRSGGLCISLYSEQLTEGTGSWIEIVEDKTLDINTIKVTQEAGGIDNADTNITFQNSSGNPITITAKGGLTEAVTTEYTNLNLIEDNYITFSIDMTGSYWSMTHDGFSIGEEVAGAGYKINMSINNQKIGPGTIYIPYSVITNENRYFQFIYHNDTTLLPLYDPDSNGVIIESLGSKYEKYRGGWVLDGVVYAEDSSGNPIIKYGGQTIVELKDKSVYKYKGARLVRSIKQTFDPVTQKYVQIYETNDTDKTKHYYYSDAVYNGIEYANNYVTSGEDASSTAGWVMNDYNELDALYSTNSGNYLRFKKLVDNISDANRYVYNNAFENIGTDFASIKKGDQIVLRVRFSDTNHSPNSYADNDKVNGIKLCQYDIKDNKYVPYDTNYITISGTTNEWIKDEYHFVVTSDDISSSTDLQSKTYYKIDDTNSGTNTYIFVATTEYSASTVYYEKQEGWYYKVYTFNKNFTADNLSDNYGFFFRLASTTGQRRYDNIQITKYIESTVGIYEDGEVIKESRPKASGETYNSADTTNVVEYKDYYYEADKFTTQESIIYDDATVIGTLVPQYTFEKSNSIEASESNYYNIIQTLSENYECWPQFTVNRNNDGSIITKNYKKVYPKKFDPNKEYYCDGLEEKEIYTTKEEIDKEKDYYDPYKDYYLYDTSTKIFSEANFNNQYILLNINNSTQYDTVKNWGRPIYTKNLAGKYCLHYDPINKINNGYVSGLIYYQSLFDNYITTYKKAQTAESYYQYNLTIDKGIKSSLKINSIKINLSKYTYQYETDGETHFDLVGDISLNIQEIGVRYTCEIYLYNEGDLSNRKILYKDYINTSKGVKLSEKSYQITIPSTDFYVPGDLVDQVDTTYNYIYVFIDRITNTEGGNVFTRSVSFIPVTAETSLTGIEVFKALLPDNDIQYYEKGTFLDKQISFKDYITNKNYAGIKYGKNLSSISRTLVSDSIVTKLLVKDNSNEYGENGFCTVKRSTNNPTYQNFLYDFYYYIKTKQLDEDTVNEDLNDYYGKLKTILAPDKTDSYSTITAAISKLSNELTVLEANATVYRAEIKELPEQISEAKGRFFSTGDTVSGYNSAWYYHPTWSQAVAVLKEGNIESGTAYKTKIDKDKTGYDASDLKVGTYLNLNSECLKDATTIYEGTKNYNEAKNKLSVVENQIAEKNKSLYDYNKTKSLMETRQQLANDEFTAKYANFIKEGSWIDEDQIDDDLYYMDAVSTLRTSAQPQVTYNISMVDLSPLPGYELYSFKIGDKTFVEDPEFFGDNTKEEVIISEIKYNLTNPSQNSVTVQNYKTRFEDLFQRISATVQSVQYSEGAYNRAASSVGAFTIDQDKLVNSLQTLTNTSIMTSEYVDISDEGLIVKDTSNTGKKIKINAGGIKRTNDGVHWQDVLSVDGLNSSTLTAGKINTEKLSIYNEGQPTFKWDKLGITAWGLKDDGNINPQKFVRVDRNGIYGVEYSTDFKVYNEISYEYVGLSDDIEDFSSTTTTYYKYITNNEFCYYEPISTQPATSVKCYTWKEDFSTITDTIYYKHRSTETPSTWTEWNSSLGIDHTNYYYAIKEGKDWEYVSYDDLKENNGRFGLTWNGFFLKSNSGTGYVEISDSNDLIVNDGEKDKIIIGNIKEEGEISDKYGIKIYNDDGNTVFTTDSDGNLEITGKITAKAGGSIAGFTIEENSLTAESRTNKVTISPLYIKLGTSGSEEFQVDDSGNLQAINATISGTLKTTVFEKDTTRVVGGISLFKDSSRILSIVNDTYESLTNQFYIETSQTSLFTGNDKIAIVSSNGDSNDISYDSIVAINKNTGLITIKNGYVFSKDKEYLVIKITDKNWIIGINANDTEKSFGLKGNSLTFNSWNDDYTSTTPEVVVGDLSWINTEESELGDDPKGLYGNLVYLGKKDEVHTIFNNEGMYIKNVLLEMASFTYSNKSPQIILGDSSQHWVTITDDSITMSEKIGDAVHDYLYFGNNLITLGDDQGYYIDIRNNSSENCVKFLEYISANEYKTWALFKNSEIILGNEDSNHSKINTTGMSIYSGNLTVASFTNGEIILGNEDSNHSKINTTGMSIYSGNLALASFTNGEINLYPQGPTALYSSIDSTGISLKRSNLIEICSINYMNIRYGKSSYSHSLIDVNGFRNETWNNISGTSRNEIYLFSNYLEINEVIKDSETSETTTKQQVYINKNHLEIGENLTSLNTNFSSVRGQYNNNNGGLDLIDVVGWGAEDELTNLSALTTDGDLRIKGDIYIGCNVDSTGGQKVVTSDVLKIETKTYKLSTQIDGGSTKQIEDTITLEGYTPLGIVAIDIQNIDSESSTGSDSLGAVQFGVTDTTAWILLRNFASSARPYTSKSYNIVYKVLYKQS